MLVDMRSHSSSANLLCFSHVGVLLSSKWSSLSLPRISSNRTFGPHRPSSYFNLKLSGSGVGKHVFQHRISQVRAMDEFLSFGEVPASSAPSSFRKARPRKPREMINHHVGATISRQSVPGQNIVLVRPRTLGQTNPKEHNGPVPMEGDEEIFEEDAVCKKCFNHLKEENILKTECKCGNALIREECAAEWSRTRGNNNCDYCGQEVQTFPVTLVRGLSSSTQVVGREESNKWSLFSRLMRF